MISIWQKISQSTIEWNIPSCMISLNEGMKTMLWDLWRLMIGRMFTLCSRSR